MSTRHILGDWGVSACRLFLMEGDRAVAETRGPGVKFVGNAESTFRDLTRDWSEDVVPPTLLCGTIGANIGWTDAGYVTAPSTIADIASAAVGIDGLAVRILPGVRTSANAYGTSDVMRSEDLQALGWSQLNARTDATLCLPGSHTKWVEIENGRLANFTTGFVGELFEVLSDHSVLTEAEGDGDSRSAFSEGVDLGRRHPAPLSGLFHVRALAAQNFEGGAASRERLSGFLVGLDCASMVRALDRSPDAIIGDGRIAEAYRRALAQMGADVPTANGDDCVIAGLMAAHAHCPLPHPG